MLKLPKDGKALFGLSTIAVISLVILVLWRVPQWTIPDTVTDEKDKAELLNANRENIFKGIQTIAGLGVVGTAYLAWRNSQLTEDKNVTERFSKAVEMLADEKLEVRLGGIYSLERIAKDSKEDHPVILEVLAAFIRERSALRTEQHQSFVTSFLSRQDSQNGNVQIPAKLSLDIQSALTVIGRRTPQENESTINLANANIRGADLNAANLSNTDLSGANLCGANLCGVNLRDANLIYADLSNAYLRYADFYNTFCRGVRLHGADLSGVNLSKTSFPYADLSGADLSSVKLHGVSLRDANLCGARLYDANLRGARLYDANLCGADLNGARNLTKEQLVHPKLCRTILPDGTILNRDCEELRIDPETGRDIR